MVNFAGMRSIKTFHLFRKIAIAEGISFLILLLIAMPLKYFADQPMPVTVIGYLHGILFVAFAVLAIKTMIKYRKNFWWLVKAGLASLLPFGTFVMDKEWKKEEQVIKDLPDQRPPA